MDASVIDLIKQWLMSRQATPDELANADSGKTKALDIVQPGARADDGNAVRPLDIRPYAGPMTRGGEIDWARVPHESVGPADASLLDENGNPLGDVKSAQAGYFAPGESHRQHKKDDEFMRTKKMMRGDK